MKFLRTSLSGLILIILSALMPAANLCSAGQYTNFDVAIYIPVNVVRSFSNPGKLNDEWRRGYPLLLMDRYSKGVLYIWTIPDNFNDLYRLPVEVTTAFKNHILRGFPVQLDGQSQVALFAYDNGTFVAESFLPRETDVKVSVASASVRLRNLVTGLQIDGQPSPSGLERYRARDRDKLTAFTVHLLPHSYAAFSIEK